jgi:hypothetical protein
MSVKEDIRQRSRCKCEGNIEFHAKQWSPPYRDTTNKNKSWIQGLLILNFAQFLALLITRGMEFGYISFRPTMRQFSSRQNALAIHVIRRECLHFLTQCLTWAAPPFLRLGSGLLRPTYLLLCPRIPQSGCQPPRPAESHCLRRDIASAMSIDIALQQ